MKNVTGKCSSLDPLAAVKAGFVLMCTLGLGEAIANDEPILFDPEVLRQRGIDPRLAEYFGAAPRFMPGVHRIDLTVNGRSRGKVDARFDHQGALCFDASLLRAAGLVGEEDSQGCAAFMQRFAHSQVRLEPGTNEVVLTVPDAALVKIGTDLSGYSSGGAAGIVNYELFGMNNRTARGTNRSTSARTEVGFNAGDWVVRSHQLYLSDNQSSQFQQVDAYAQRTFAGIGSVLQVGEIQLSNPVLGGAQITGVQLMSEQALAQRGGQAQVEGVSQGTARVEVRQAGQLIYTTIVPGGPFVVRDVPRVNQRSGLDVTVIEADGGEHSFSVSAAQAGIDTPGNGYVVGVGQLRNAYQGDASTVASAGWTGSLGRQTHLSVGAMLADQYRSLGTSVGHQPWTGAQVNVDVLSAKATGEAVSGVQSRLSVGQRLGQEWTFNGSVTQQSSGYRELLDSDYRNAEHHQGSRMRTQWNAGVNWSHGVLGSLNASYSQSALFDGSVSSRTGVSWAKSIKGASVSLTAERDLGRRGGLHHEDAGRGSNSVYASVSLPLGERRRLRTSYSDANDRKRVTTQFSDSPSDTLSYRVGAERNLVDGRENFSAGVSVLPRYAQVNLGYSGDGAQQNSVNAGVSGGLVVHGGGITPSATPIGDTFALVKVGDVSGVRINTSSGPAWTDGTGHAVVSRVNAYSPSSVEVATQSLPRNVDITDGARQFSAGRGAVETIDFGVQITRRVLLDVRQPSGTVFPAGTSVVDEQKLPVGQIEQDGTVFLPNATSVGRLWISSSEMPDCELQFELPKEPDASAYYENVSAVCLTS